jgi:hypothetical protein
MAGTGSRILVASPENGHPGEVVIRGAFLDVLPGEGAKRAGKAPRYSEYNTRAPGVDPTIRKEDSGEHS